MILIGVLLLPSTASAQEPHVPAQSCGDVCGLDLYFVQQYTRTDTNYYRAHTARVMKSNGVRRPYRDETREAVYLSLEEDGSIVKKWCKKHSKACKAAIACIVAAATSIHKDINDNEAKPADTRKSAQTITRDAAGVCALAAVAVWVAL